jgi:hypothetical protein
MNDEQELHVLSIVVDGSDPEWDERMIIVGTQAKLATMFDLTQLPAGAILMKGKAAKRFLAKGMQDEAAYQKQQAMKSNMRNN